MKLSLRVTFVLLLSLSSFFGYSQNQRKKAIETIFIKTKIYCDHCKICESCGGRILKDLYNVDGIKNTEVDSKANTIKVTYDTRKINIEQIRKKISQMGFDADELKAEPSAVARLDDCCKKPS